MAGSLSYQSPCTVYPESTGSPGRVTTPLGDLYFANVFGGTVSMARQLGRMSASEIREGAQSFLGHFTEDVLEALFHRRALGPARWAAQRLVLSRIERTLPDDYLAVLRAYAEGGGVDVDNAVAAQLLWDLWSLVQEAPVGPVQATASAARRRSPLLDAFSLYLPRTDGGPLHLRWMDNAAVDRWDRKQVLAFFHPDRGLSYALLSSVGFLTGMPVGMNVAGLALSVEPGGRGGLRRDGVPLGPATREVLAGAQTIEEAVAILRQSSPLSPWRYLMTEGDTGRAAVFDASIGELEWVQGEAPQVFEGVAAAPGYQTERIQRWHRGRRARLDEALSGWDPDREDKVYRSLMRISPLSGLGNVSAVVMEPAARRLWVAAGRSPVGRRWFVPFHIKSGGGGFDTSVRPLKAGEWESTPHGRALEQLRHALQLQSSGEPPQRILIALEHCLALYPDEPGHHILAGLMALKAQRGRRAEGAFRRALNLLEDPGHRAEVGLYLAWALDLEDRRKAARKLYDQLRSDPTMEASLKARARNYRRRRFRSVDAQALEIDFLLATVH